MPYPGHSLGGGGSYPSAEKQLVYSTAPADWATLSRIGAGLCIYHLLAWSNLNFLHISQLITLPIQSCLVLYSYCANLLHSLIMWLMVTFLSSNSLHLLFCCILSILTLIWLVLMALFCAAIRRDSVSFLAMSRFCHMRCCWLVV